MCQGVSCANGNELLDANNPSHIEQASKDVGEVRISSDKISRRFQQIERVELDHPEAASAHLIDADE